LDAADQGVLGTADGLRDQIERMLDDARAREQALAFVRAWFGYDAVLGLAKNAESFPAFTRSRARELVADTDRWLEGALGDPAGGALDAFLPGALTQPSLLASLAHPTQGSPVRRGYFVRTRILCQSVPPPPPDVVFAVAEPAGEQTTRERFATVSAQPLCASCHERIDPIGYTFEHYDAVGARREREAGRPVDARGTLTGTDVDGEYDDAEALAHALGTSTIVRACAVAQAFRWGYVRAERDDDACTLAAMGEAFTARGHRVADLLSLVAESEAFRTRPPGGAGEGACP
jgi:hypothetical protein